MSTPLIDPLELTRDAGEALVVSWDYPATHARRLWKYLHRDAIDAPAAMTDLPIALRSRLEVETMFRPLVTAGDAHSRDGYTRKFLLRLFDGQQIETVLMRYPGRVTACLSTQVGCAMGCVFCATGQQGFARNLTAGEIVSQALHVDRLLRGESSAPPGKRGSRRDCGERLRNIVLMGMGEPLHNYDAVMKAVDILRDPSGLAVASSRITLSTVGVVPGIIRLADERRLIRLAVSLHAATQAERAALVPVASAWPLDELLAACRDYATKLDQRIFFEWTLIAGTNDSPDHAHALGQLLRGLPSHVNLIPLNRTEGYAGRPSHSPAARQFQAILGEYHLPSTIRQRRGIDIAAGCGQLASPATARR